MIFQIHETLQHGTAHGFQKSWYECWNSFPNGGSAVRSATGEIEGVGGGDYQRIYVPSRVSNDSTFPFSPGDGFRLQIVETICNRSVLVMTSDALELDKDETELVLQRSSREVQTSLEEVDADD